MTNVIAVEKSLPEKTEKKFGGVALGKPCEMIKTSSLSSLFEY